MRTEYGSLLLALVATVAAAAVDISGGDPTPYLTFATVAGLGFGTEKIVRKRSKKKS